MRSIRGSRVFDSDCFYSYKLMYGQTEQFQSAKSRVVELNFHIWYEFYEVPNPFQSAKNRVFEFNQ